MLLEWAKLHTRECADDEARLSSGGAMLCSGKLLELLLPYSHQGSGFCA